MPKAPSTLPRSHLFGAQPLLLPVNPRFIWLTLVIAWMINLMPWGQWPGVPDVLALTLIFWSVHEPRKIGMFAAFLFGLLMDVHQARLLGEHALAYTLLSYFAIALHRRIQWFGPIGQALHVLPLLLVTQLVVYSVRAALSGTWPGWSWMLDSVVAAALWPIADRLLLAPQRRAPVRDDTRPI